MRQDSPSPHVCCAQDPQLRSLVLEWVRLVDPWLTHPSMAAWRQRTDGELFPEVGSFAPEVIAENQCWCMAAGVCLGGVPWGWMSAAALAPAEHPPLPACSSPCMLRQEAEAPPLGVRAAQHAAYLSTLWGDSQGVQFTMRRQAQEAAQAKAVRRWRACLSLGLYGGPVCWAEAAGDEAVNRVDN